MAFSYSKNPDGTKNEYQVEDRENDIIVSLDLAPKKISLFEKGIMICHAQYSFDDGTIHVVMDIAHSQHEDNLREAIKTLSSTSPRFSYSKT